MILHCLSRNFEQQEEHNICAVIQQQVELCLEITEAGACCKITVANAQQQRRNLFLQFCQSRFELGNERTKLRRFCSRIF